jgi:hypothetical protein
MTYLKRPTLEGENTLAERLQLLRDRYYVFVGPLLLLLGVGLGSSAILVWTAGALLVLLTLNVLLPHLAHRPPPTRSGH